MYIKREFMKKKHTEVVHKKPVINVTVTGVSQGEEFVKVITRKTARGIARLSGKRVRCSVKPL